MVVEKLGAAALIAISKATGALALLAFVPAFKTGTSADIKVRLAGQTRVAQGDAITIPANRLGTAGQWSRLERISDGASDFASSARSYHERASAALDVTASEVVAMREALGSIGLR